MAEESIIHKIRNHLNTISMHGELGKLTLQQGGNTTQVEKSLSVILQECHKCAQTLNDAGLDDNSMAKQNNEN